MYIEQKLAKANYFSHSYSCEENLRFGKADYVTNSRLAMLEYHLYITLSVFAQFFAYSDRSVCHFLESISLKNIG